MSLEEDKVLLKRRCYSDTDLLWYNEDQTISVPMEGEGSCDPWLSGDSMLTVETYFGKKQTSGLWEGHDYGNGTRYKVL